MDHLIITHGTRSEVEQQLHRHLPAAGKPDADPETVADKLFDVPVGDTNHHATDINGAVVARAANDEGVEEIISNVDPATPIHTRAHVTQALRDALQTHGDTTVPDAAHSPLHGDACNGRPPLGHDTAAGQLVESDQYEQVCRVLAQVDDGAMSKRQAARTLDTTRRTVTRCLTGERRRWYRLDAE